MSRVIMTLGFVVTIVAYVVGLWGLAATADGPTSVSQPTTNPFKVVANSHEFVVYGIITMMATTLALVMVFAHGSRVGDQE